jgi:uncharacterized protein
METPCNKICIIDPASALCRGCGRTGDEIARWSGMTGDERRAIMTTLPARMQAAGLPPASPVRE